MSEIAKIPFGPVLVVIGAAKSPPEIVIEAPAIAGVNSPEITKGKFTRVEDELEMVIPALTEIAVEVEILAAFVQLSSVMIRS